MSNLKKILARLDRRYRDLFELIYGKLIREETVGLDIVKLKGHADIYRVKKGRLRIIYKKNNSIEIIAIDLRNEKTYKNL